MLSPTLTTTILMPRGGRIFAAAICFSIVNQANSGSFGVGYGQIATVGRSLIDTNQQTDNLITATIGTPMAPAGGDHMLSQSYMRADGLDVRVNINQAITCLLNNVVGSTWAVHFQIWFYPD